MKLEKKIAVGGWLPVWNKKNEEDLHHIYITKSNEKKVRKKDY